MANLFSDWMKRLNRHACSKFPCYAVRYKDLMDEPYADVCNLLKSCGDVCAIVYCLERTACDDLASHLSRNGVACAGNLKTL